MSRLILSLAAGALTLGVAASPSAATPARQCFSSGQVRTVHPVGDKQVNVLVGSRDIYRIDLAVPCPGMRQPARIFDFSPIASGAGICGPSDVRLAVVVNGGRSECIIDTMRKLTPEEVAALPKKERP